jgi:hypothetical protein
MVKEGKMAKNHAILLMNNRMASPDVSLTFMFY